MATWQSDYDEHIKNNTAATQKKITERQTANTNMSNQYVADVNAIVDQSTENAVNKVQNEIDKLPTQYQSGYDANAIQQKINERQVAERMANLGLTDSGLNRTQQTAINIQRSNADAALTQQKNAATASLRQQIADLYSSAETQKMQTAADAKYQLAQTNQNVYNTYMDNLESSAVTYANNQATNRANIEKARISATASQKDFTADIIDEATELYSPSNPSALYAYADRLLLQGYTEAQIAQLIALITAEENAKEEVSTSSKGKQLYSAPIGPTTSGDFVLK